MTAVIIPGAIFRPEPLDNGGQLVAQFDTNSLAGIETLDEELLAFGPGERGELRLPLSRESLLDNEEATFQAAARSLEGHFQGLGFEPWPELPGMVTLDWRKREVSIFFQATLRTEEVRRRIRLLEEQAEDIAISEEGFARYAYQPAAYAVALRGIMAALTRRASLALARNRPARDLAERTGYAKGFLDVSPRIAAQQADDVVKTARQLKAWQQSALTGLKYTGIAIRAVRPYFTYLIVGGLLIFVWLDPERAGRLFRWAATKAGELAADVVENVLKPVAEGFWEGLGLGEINWNIVLIGVAGGVLIIGGVMSMGRR